MEHIAASVLANQNLIIGATIIAALFVVYLAGWLARVLLKPALVIGAVLLVGLVLYYVNPAFSNRVIEKTGTCFSSLKKHTEQASVAAVKRINQRQR